MPTPETARPLASLASPTARAAIPTSEHPGAAASGAAGAGAAADAPRHDWTDAEIAAVHELALTELVFRAQLAHRRHHDPTRVQLCTLLSIKTGGCPEDCGYCPQSAHYETGVERQGLLPLDEVLAKARQARAAGSTRFCMGAAWRQVRDGAEFERVLAMVRGVRELGLEACCTLGMLTREQRLRAVPELLKMTDDKTLDDSTRGWVFQALRDITGASIAADAAAWRAWWAQHRSDFRG